MKKLFSLLICVTLVCTTILALADDTGLREAIEAGKTIVLKKTALTMPGEDLVGTPIGISPDGQTVIWSAGQSFFLSRNGQITEIHAAPERGTGDPYKKLDWELEALLRVMPPDEGFAWSPDGRYVLLCSKRLAIQQMMALDLIMLDAVTGESFPVQSFEGGSMERGDFILSTQSQDFGMVIEARFDNTGRNIWFIGRVNALSDTYSLFCFSMETGEMEIMLENIGIATSARSLYEECGGGWLLMVSSDNGMSSDTHDVWIRFNPEQPSSWISSDFDGDTVKGSVQKTERGFLRDRFCGRQAFLSPKTGYGLVLVSAPVMMASNMASLASSQAADLVKASIAPRAYYMARLNRITCNDAEPNTYWEVRRDLADSDSLCVQKCDSAIIDLLERLSRYEEMTEADWNLLYAYTQEVNEEDPPSICCISLSPGGEYALLCINDNQNDQAMFRLLDIETMTLYPVENPEGLSPVLYGSGLNGRFLPGIVWNEDGTLMILTGNTVETFRMEVR